MEKTVTDVRKQYLDALKNGDSYDFICNNYFNFSKDELKDIILELTYAIDTEAKNFASAEEIMSSVYDELTDLRWSFDE